MTEKVDIFDKLGKCNEFGIGRDVIVLGGRKAIVRW